MLKNSNEMNVCNYDPIKIICIIDLQNDRKFTFKQHLQC